MQHWVFGSNQIWRGLLDIPGYWLPEALPRRMRCSPAPGGSTRHSASASSVRPRGGWCAAWILGPGVLGIAPAQVSTHARVAVVPEGLQVCGDGGRASRGGEQVQQERDPAVGRGPVLRSSRRPLAVARRAPADPGSSRSARSTRWAPRRAQGPGRRACPPPATAPSLAGRQSRRYDEDPGPSGPAPAAARARSRGPASVLRRSRRATGHRARGGGSRGGRAAPWPPPSRRGERSPRSRPPRGSRRSRPARVDR